MFGKPLILDLPDRFDRETAAEGTWTVNFSEGLNSGGQHFDLPGGISVKAEADWIAEAILLVRISIDMRVAGECARCLKDAELAISDSLVYIYLRYEADLDKNQVRALGDGFIPVEVRTWDRTLDITEQVRETVFVFLPAKLLCKKNCAGLCSNCGADLNDGPCSCEEESDPRLIVLKDFKNIVIETALETGEE
jgi:uncharacterized protein